MLANSNSSRSSRQAAALAALLACAVLGAATPSLAQQPQPTRPPAAAAPRPAAPAAPAGQPAPAQGQQAAPPSGPTIVQLKPEPSQTDWLKVCGKDPATQKEICYTTRDFVTDQGQPVLSMAVYDMKGDANRMVRLIMPHGFLLQPGIRFGTDNGQPTPGRYMVCFPNGCLAEAAVPSANVDAMKRGTNFNISAQNQAAREITFAVPLAGFGKGFDGPPIDPAVLQAQQQKLQEELQKRATEQRQQLQGAAPAAPGAPAAAPAPAAPRP